METKEKTAITIDAIINAPIDKVWNYWTTPEHIIHWNNASEDWCTPSAINDLRAGGKFLFKMEAKDGSFGFEFEGVYTDVKDKEVIVYKLADERQVTILFSSEGEHTKIVETFEAEEINTIALQREGWQAILNNFKKYCELN
jgi:uncharacterized protein YndB with AHSA1/START domain